MLYKVFLSTLAMFLTSMHLFHPEFELDTIAIVLILLAIAPWITHLIKSVELPGGTKIDLKALKDIEVNMARAGLLEEAEHKSDMIFFSENAAYENPRIALACLFFEVEKTLKSVAEIHHIPAQHNNLDSLLGLLYDKKIISYEQKSALLQLIALLIRAFQDCKIDKNASNWALRIGPKIIKSMDKYRF
ncbi:hypothetical protein [Desulfitibacter alkalitolerans]|uniref:hypothetical protein n=1 Tax=Desulfitibacter alkalitolerans TaxID=264641 RepID=UPI000482FA12|nr:hypothetical protein [Desulfitibacter alkalitolerans]